MSPSGEVRRAGLDDVDAVVALVESAYRGDRAAATWSSEAHLLGGQRVDADMVRAAVTSDDAEVLVLVDGAGDGEVVLLACCELSAPSATGAAKLGMFAVDPDRQTGGIGRRMLAEGERDAVLRWGATQLELEVIDQRHELIAWYERRGYRRSGEHRPFPYGDKRFGEPRRDDLRFAVLVKDLSAET